MANLYFHWLDYVVFVVSLLISLGIGIFFSLTGGRQKTNSEYLMGDRRLSLIPVALSLLVSYISAVTILGHPAEMYLYGTQYALSWFGSGLAAIMAGLIWVPLFYPLKLTSVNEYLKMRFDSNLVKYIGCFFTVFGALSYTGICLFGPSTAIEQVTGFPVWASIILSGSVATVYTTIGGMKAVIWTDVFQSGVLLAGVIAVVVQGCIMVGGGSRVWELAGKGGRIIFDELSVDPTKRMTLWGTLLGSIIPWFTMLGVIQTSVQRYISIPTMKKAQGSVIATTAGMFAIGPLACFAGVVLFAYYYDKRCDPLEGKMVENPNQLMPYFVMEILNFPGVPGLFIAAAFSASLSSGSSAINASAACIWSDILKDKIGRVSEEKAATITKIVGFVAGVFSIAIGIFIINVGGTVVQSVISVSQATLMPVFVLYTLGAFFPWTNKWGVITGSLVSGILPLWLNMGSYYIKSHAIVLPTLIDGCPIMNSSNVDLGTVSMTTETILNVTAAAVSDESGFLEDLYRLSHMWINPFAAILGILIGLIVSFATGRTHLDEIEPVLMFSWIRSLWCCCLKGKCAGEQGVTMDYKYKATYGDVYAKESIRMQEIPFNEDKLANV